METKKEHSTLKRIMAKRCDMCPMCKYARANPDALISRAVAWHGSFCPFWQAWQQVYGESSTGQSSR